MLLDIHLELIHRQMPNHMSSEIQLIVHAKLQVLLISVTDPIPTNLDQLPRNAYLKGPSGATSPKGMPCEFSGILNAPQFEDLAKSVDKNSGGECFDMVLIQEDKCRTVWIHIYEGN